MLKTDEYRLSRSIKYKSLYWTLGYREQTLDIFTKFYKKYKVSIYANEQYADFGDGVIQTNNKKFTLNDDQSFVILECVDKLLEMGYLPQEIVIDRANDFDIYVRGLYIKCYHWGQDFVIDRNETLRGNYFLRVHYASRLRSGLIQRKAKILTYEGKEFDYGIFENTNRSDSYELSKKKSVLCDDASFVIDGDCLIGFLGNAKQIVIPDGIRSIDSCAFWDNQYIEEITLPESVVDIGGDTFFNCRKLAKFVIKPNVKSMGNNPFAGCENLSLVNESAHFVIQDNVLFDAEIKRLIYFPINDEKDSYVIPNTVEILGKHSFFDCKTLLTVTVPSSVEKFENNPFSGCAKLTIDNKSPYYHIVDDVIYNVSKTEIVGVLNSVSTNRLVLLETTKVINRNSFYNCINLGVVVLPKGLEEIGYNPFVGCKNVSFESKSPNFVVDDGVLYDRNKGKLICYPHNKAIGHVIIEESVTVLERGAFSGCEEMTSVNLRNVAIISKACFTNCSKLSNIYCSDFVCFIGEWAFSHCNSLKTISLFTNTYVDRNAFINSPVKVDMRKSRSNYIVESDNIHTLKSLRYSYAEKIDSIIIDPPYCSHISNIGYEDNIFPNSYYDFIYQRLVFAKELLSISGFLVISIDKGSLPVLKAICYELFSRNLVTVHKWEKLHRAFDANRTLINKKRIRYEYILVCQKSNQAVLRKIQQPYIKNGSINEKDEKLPRVFSCFGTTSSAKDEMALLFGSRDYFSTPKPLKLIKELIRATSKHNSIVLDFFAGSGTTGHAVLALNKEDGGTRTFILVNNSESDICKNVLVPRINKIRENVNVVTITKD